MPECLQDIMPIPDYTLRMATHVLPCFEVGIHREDNPYCIMLTKMVYYHIPFEDADRGWYTIVSRITARSSRTGHLLSVKSRNLQRMG